MRRDFEPLANAALEIDRYRRQHGLDYVSIAAEGKIKCVVIRHEKEGFTHRVAVSEEAIDYAWYPTDPIADSAEDGLKAIENAIEVRPVVELESE